MTQQQTTHNHNTISDTKELVLLSQIVPYKRNASTSSASKKRIRLPHRQSLLWISIFAIAAIIGIAVFTYSGAQDSDMWWLFATGREICENGIPYMNPFSIYDDQAIVIQQWLPAAIDWLIFSNFGYIGIGIMVFILTMLLSCSAFYTARVVMGKSGNEIAWCVIATMIGCCSAYLSVRPQVWSMIAFMLLLGVLEKYRQTNNPRILIWLPIIVCVHANLHLSMMPFDFFIVFCYMLPYKNISTYFTPKENDYKRLPMLIAFGTMFIAACLNPYGIDGALYLLNSFGSAEYGNNIAEMGTISPYDSYYGILMMIMIILGAIGIGRNGLKHVDIPLSILYIVCVFLSIQHVRNVWLVAIFATILFLSSIRGIRLKPKINALKDDNIKINIGLITCAVLLCVGIADNAEFLDKEENDNPTTPVAAADYLDNIVLEEQINIDDIAVFTHFNAGGYLEYRGYKVSMDARPELWDNKISHSGENRYQEYIDLTKDRTTVEEYLEGKRFDYLIVNTDTAMYKYIVTSKDYMSVVNSDSYVMFKKVEQII